MHNIVAHKLAFWLLLLTKVWLEIFPQCLPNLRRGTASCIACMIFLQNVPLSDWSLTCHPESSLMLFQLSLLRTWLHQISIHDISTTRPSNYNNFGVTLMKSMGRIYCNWTNANCRRSGGKCVRGWDRQSFSQPTQVLSSRHAIWRGCCWQFSTPKNKTSCRGVSLIGN